GRHDAAIAALEGFGSGSARVASALAEIKAEAARLAQQRAAELARQEAARRAREQWIADRLQRAPPAPARERFGHALAAIDEVLASEPGQPTAAALLKTVLQTQERRRKALEAEAREREKQAAAEQRRRRQLDDAASQILTLIDSGKFEKADRTLARA